MRATLRTLLAGLLGLALSLPGMAADVRIAELRDLQADARTASQRQLPILVLFSASYCGYCDRVKDDFLRPMLISGDYTNRVLIRVLEIDSGNLVRDLDGKLVDPEQLAARYNIQLTPTVAFIDGKGREVAQRVVGLTTVDFYGGYLDDSIDYSLLQLRGKNRLSRNGSAPRLQ